MLSPTQRRLDAAALADLIQPALATTVTDARELSGGGFAAVWQASLADGRTVVVKVGPPPGAKLLRYERGLIAAEADYFRTVAGRAPVPEVLHVTEDWLVTTLLPGRMLSDGPDAPEARYDLGRAVAAVHELTGPRFGYPGDRPSAGDWPTAFTAIMADLLADARDWHVPLPPGIAGTVARHRPALAAATRPALLHFDLWDGNVLVTGGRLSGLVDGERHLYGDPLLDLVSPALFRRIEDEPAHPFLRGYLDATGLRLDAAARLRLTLYRIHLYTLMLAEGPSRGIPVGGERHDFVTRLLTEELTLASSGPLSPSA